MIHAMRASAFQTSRRPHTNLVNHLNSITELMRLLDKSETDQWFLNLTVSFFGVELRFPRPTHEH